MNWLRSVGLAVISTGLGACVAFPSMGDREDSVSQADRQRIEAIQGENHALTIQVAALQLDLVQRAAEISRLSAALELSKKQLDEAVLEVVRSKAKLGSLGNRAEAATALAEGESLAKTMRARSAAATSDPDIAAAERLLALGNQEFKNENFGGAYYLASNARTAFAVLAARSAGPVPSAEGDRPGSTFAAPVRLAFSVRGNVRDRPSTDAKPIRVLDKGSVVKAIAAKDLWVLIEMPDGQRGWAFYDLLVPPKF